MIGTIRKHSKWLWLVIATLTIISFIYWGAGPSRIGDDRGGRVSGDYGSIYGHKITEQAFFEARNNFFLLYWFRSGGEWPDRNPNFTEAVLQKEIYIRLMLIQKAADLGIHVSDEAVVSAANELLRSVGRNGQAIPLENFVKQILQSKGLTAQDFKNFTRQYLILDQLQQAIGLTGELVTPQEAAVAYQRDYEELSAQIVFFSASNRLAQVAVTPAAIEQFYTNRLAEYRLPDRAQVRYVAFELSNYLAAAEQKLGQTNLDNQVDMTYRQYGLKGVPEAKTPEEARAKIREALIQQQAGKDARLAANEFAQEVFSQQPVKPENLAAVAQQKGLAVRLTAPFAADFGPEEFLAPPGFVKAAFSLSPDEPFAGPIPGATALYVLAFDKKMPSEIPALDQIRDRVSRNYQWSEAMLLARQAGTNFARTLMTTAADRSFASVCVAAGFPPQLLPPFSLSTRELPELGNHAELNQLKQAAFSTPPGKTSGFVDTADGGFIVYVQSRLPLDQAKMNSNLPQYMNALRRQRLSEAFNQWVNLEANRQLRNTPGTGNSSPAPPNKPASPAGPIRDSPPNNDGET
jgi:hypothetical protein